jgi:hypothetical protein
VRRAACIKPGVGPRIALGNEPVLGTAQAAIRPSGPGAEVGLLPGVGATNRARHADEPRHLWSAGAVGRRVGRSSGHERSASAPQSTGSGWT